MIDCTCKNGYARDYACPVGGAVGSHSPGSWIDDDYVLHLPTERSASQYDGSIICACTPSKPDSDCAVGRAIGNHPPGSRVDANGELHLPAVSATDLPQVSPPPLPEVLKSFGLFVSVAMGGTPTITARINDRTFDLAPMAGVGRLSPGAEALIQSMYETLRGHFADYQVVPEATYVGLCAIDSCGEPAGETCDDDLCITHCALVCGAEGN